MKNYQFRTNWLGYIILQRRVIVSVGYFGDPEYGYVDADIQDLKDYYTQLHSLAEPCDCDKQRELFERDCI